MRWKIIDRVLASALALAAIIALFLQLAAIREGQDEFNKRLIADHKLHQQEVALSLWDQWNENLYRYQYVTDDVRRMRKWLSSIPSPHSDVPAAQLESYREWLTLFVRCTRLPTQDAERILATQPDHIRSAFRSALSDQQGDPARADPNLNKPLTLQDVQRIRSSVVSLLNLLEKVSVAYDCEAADRPMLDRAFKEAVATNVWELRPFMDHYRSKDGEDAPQAWDPLYDVIIADKGAWHPSGTAVRQTPQAAIWQDVLQGKYK
jgi:hypothetical protein